MKDLLYGGTETAKAFDGVLPPESLSFAGQAAISRLLACQSTPEPVPGPISLSGTAGPAACGETRMVGSLSGRNSVRANRPDTATKSQRNPSFSGGHNGGQDTLWKSISPLYEMLYITVTYSRRERIKERTLAARRLENLKTGVC